MPALLSSSTFTPRCRLTATRRAAPARPCSAVAAVKPESNQFFDLKDLESTTGSWDVYGVQETKRYNELQNTFFDRAAAAVTRREAMYSTLLFGSVIAFPLLWGGIGSKALKLPITIGPQQPRPLGPRDRL